MWKNLTFKKVIAIIKLSLYISLTWPLPKDTVKFKLICAELYHYLCMILSLTLIVGLINTIRNNLDDPVIIAKSIFFIMAAMHTICIIVCCKINSYRLQFITCEMENFCQSIKSHEETIIQQYIDKCCNFYGGSIIWFAMSSIIVIVGPAALDQPFPTNAEYPFDIYRQPLRSIIFVHQSFLSILTSSSICINVFMALLLWYTSAKFKLLTQELRAITDIYGLMKCIGKHHELLKYAEEVVALVRPFALTTVGITTFSTITMGLVFFTGPPLTMTIQCIILMFTGLCEVFMYTWPAEHLIYCSSEVGQAVFDAQWYKQSTDFQKIMPIIILRAQKPIVVTIPCLMPSLSLSYYTSYLSTIFSYFSALRILMQNNKDEV